MCIIILNDTGKTFTKDEIDWIIDDNPDGFGIVYLDTLEHEYGKPYRLETETRPYVAHFRYTTMGDDSDDNLHPHVISDRYLLIHNGTVKGFGDDVRSDTSQLAKLMAHMNDHDALVELMNSLAHTSRFILIDKEKNEYHIMGPSNKGKKIIPWADKDKWTIDKDGILYSKDPEKAIRKPYVAPVTKQPKSGGYEEWWQKQNAIDKKDAELYAIKSVSHPVFVYGTLKRGFGNNRTLGKNASFAGVAELEGYALDVSGSIPYCHEVGKSWHVNGELYYVDGKALANLDNLEGHPYHYERVRVSVNMGKMERPAWVYIAGHELGEGMGGYHLASTFHYSKKRDYIY